LLPQKYSELADELKKLHDVFTEAEETPSNRGKKIDRKSLLVQTSLSEIAGGFQFALRPFLVTLVMMAHCTVKEKLDLLYDLFDWSDKHTKGINVSQAFELVKTMFDRCLYFWPSQ
jgi:hypothetical protein